MTNQTMQLVDATGAAAANPQYAFSSMDATGFTINHAVTDSRTNVSLAIEGSLNVKIGNLTKPTTATGTSTISTGFNTDAVLLVSNGAGVTGPLSENRLYMGASDGSSQSYASLTDADAMDITVVKTRTSATYPMQLYGSDGTLYGTVSVATMGTSGATLEWTGSDAVARNVGYIAFGGTAASGYTENKTGFFPFF